MSASSEKLYNDILEKERQISEARVRGEDVSRLERELLSLRESFTQAYSVLSEGKVLKG